MASRHELMQVYAKGHDKQQCPLNTSTPLSTNAIISIACKLSTKKIF